VRHLQGFRIFDSLVRDQEAEGSNPFAPTTSQERYLPTTGRIAFSRFIEASFVFDEYT
jgi:hypothetical protein